jgi:type I restriction-modification system DNA methylase subunit
MPTSPFSKNIEEINVPILSGLGESGIVLTSQTDAVSDVPSIMFALETACNRFGANAVYFRYYSDRQTYIPQMYIFDFTDKIDSISDRKEIHKKMWNGCQVPAYMIVEKTQISICSSRLTPSDSNKSLSEILSISADCFKEFPSQELANGVFWETLENEKSFDFDQSATKDLIRGLKNVFHKFQSDSGLDRHVALRLLMQCLLIKYLEERDDSSTSGYFSKHYFKDNFGCDDFCSTIKKGKLLNLLDLLAKDFNGKIFEWNTDSQASARAAIQQTQVNELANYLDANIEDNQYLLWRRYSFSHLPVEVISSVYEELLTDSKDIVYTPEMIVSTLVDECMPIDKPQENFKLIDVSCGSGIFLVKAYKRLVQWWRYEQWKQTGELKKPSLDTLKNLLTYSVYGVDVEEDAINLSIFSLALAILDEVDLNPPTWEKLKFPNLSENIACKNFFEYVTNREHHGLFDLVIGNPPFNLKKENGREPSRRDYFKGVKEQYGYQSPIQVPDENPALHFLCSSMSLLKDGAMLCMIQPSSPLLYQRDERFKASLFGEYNLLQVIDFTNLDDKLWGRRRVATAAVFMEKAKPDDANVLHLIANRVFSNTHKLFLEFDHYDFHFVRKYDAIHLSYVWKANLLGGHRVKRMLDVLTKQRTIGGFLKQKKKEGWACGEGFIEWTGIGKPQRADFITGNTYLDTDDFTGKENRLRQCGVQQFLRPRKHEIYEAPHLLIRKIVTDSGLISCLYDKYVTFRNGIYSIHAPEQDRADLENLANYIDNNNILFRFMLQAMSGRAGVIKATSLNDEDIKALPYPEYASSHAIPKADEIVMSDALEYYSAPRRQDVHEKLYEEEITDLELRRYAAVFCMGIHTYACQNGMGFKLSRIISSGKYYVLQIEQKDIESPAYEECNDIIKYINTLIPVHSHQKHSAHIQKIMKICGTGVVLLIKPKLRRYWLQSIALRDSDDIFADNIMFLQSHV